MYGIKQYKVVKMEMKRLGYLVQLVSYNYDYEDLESKSTKELRNIIKVV